MFIVCETCGRAYHSDRSGAGQPSPCPYCGEKSSPAATWSARGMKRALIPLAVVMIVAGGMSAVAARKAVVRVAPSTARLYAAVGLAVNLRGLALEGVHAALDGANNKQTLTIEGALVNWRDETVETPNIRIALRDAQKREVYVWTAKALNAKLRPGERGAFRTRLAAPPNEASDVMVRFASASEAPMPVEDGF